jgi:MaoC like domain
MRELPVYQVVAKNYGVDHANKIHSDEGAAKYGFAGALVPGVGLFAYLTRPVVDAIGLEWVEHGAIRSRFIHPIYDGEKVQVRSWVVSTDPVELGLELLNHSSIVCAIGTAALPASPLPPDPENYPVRPLPPRNQLRPATLSSFSTDNLLGSLEFTFEITDEVTKFLKDISEELPIYRGSEAVCHPALWVSKANELVMQNVALGPWIHTASEAQFYRFARPGEQLSIRGRVIESYIKRGNEYIVVDLGVFGDEERPVVVIKHTALIKLGASKNNE